MPPASAEDAATTKYFHSGAFNHTQIRQDFATTFGKEARYNGDSTNDLVTLLGIIETDSRVNDIRWMAYMLATAYWETSHIVKAQRPVIDKKSHKPVVDAKSGNPVMRDIKVWRNMSPVEETGHGAGRGYYQPVKIQRMPDGSALVTEHDGDQWTLNTNGVASRVNKGAQLGAAANGSAAKAFTENTGDEQTYFGRGYVQLTWWSNYASSGAAIGRGLDLLFDPELALDPQVAYAVMARGMITGAGFANGHTLSGYFHGAHTDYTGARHMVNGADNDAGIAKIAKLFESTLLSNKIAGTPTAATSNAGNSASALP